VKNQRRLVGLCVALGASVGATEAAAQDAGGPVTLRAVYNETLRGGLTMDGWGAVSSPTAYVEGAFHLRVPRGARIVWARLFTDVVMRGQPEATATVPAGPDGFPREVVLGGTNGAITRRLEGRPDYVRTMSLTYGTFATDVTSAVRLLVGSVAPGGAVDVPVRERGDQGPSDGAVSVAPVFEGHALAVAYELDYGPRRNVTVYEGNATGTVRVADLPLRSPVANRCPAMSLLGEAFPLSIALASEYSGCQENNPLTINGTLVSSSVGGADDWPDDPRCAGPIAGLITVGSFGGADASEGTAAGAPVGLEGDSVTGRPAAPRLDDELYDARTFLTDGATAMDFNFGGNGDEVVMAIGLQSLARDQMTDADADGFSDVMEGDCTVDADRDGTPDYLDLDSDNDCLADRMESAAGRTDAALPGAPDANCVGGAPVCDRAVGVCGCRTSSDCPAATPVCDATARFCGACTTNAQCAARDPATTCMASGACERPDAGVPDAGTPDAGAADAGTPDAGVMDAGVMDAGAADAGTPDAGTPDAGVMDAGTADVGVADTGARDAGTTDVGVADAGMMDAATKVDVPADAGAADTGVEVVYTDGDDGGCGCRAGAPSRTGGALSLGLAALALVTRRRRRSVG
jgi:MYXO-CTERM domain-containing protein